MTTLWPPLPGIVFLFASSTCASVYLTSFSTQDHLGDPDAARGPCSEVSSTYAKRNIFLLPRHILSQKEVAHTKLCVCVCVYTCLHARTCAHTHTCTLIVRDTCFTTKLHFLSSMALFLSLSVGTIETISRQSLVCCFCFFFSSLFRWCLHPHSPCQRFSRRSALFLLPRPGRTLGGSVGNEASIICDLPHPLSWSVPALRLSQAWRKLIVPTLCSAAHQPHCLHFPQLPAHQRKPPLCWGIERSIPRDCPVPAACAAGRHSEWL